MGKRGSSHIGYFLRKIRPFWFQFLTAFLCNGFITILAMVPPLLMVLVFDYAYPNGDIVVFSAVVLASFAIYFIDFVFSAHIDFINIYIHQKLDYEITLGLFQKIQNLPINVFERTSIGDMTVRLTNDVGNIVRFIVNVFSDIAMGLIKLSVFLYISFNFDYKITLMALLSVPLYVIETKFYTNKEERIKQEMQNADSDVFDGIQTKLSNMRTIKVFNQQRYEAEELGIRLRKTFVLSIRESVVSIISVFTNSFTIKLWATFITWYLGYEVINGNLTIGKVVALGIYIPLLEQPIREMAGIYNEMRLTSVSTRRVASILNAKEEENFHEKHAPLVVKKGEIFFRNVSFGFNNSAQIIKDFSLHIPPKSSVAFVGESGSGKSTLLNLLLRFYKCQEGGIFIDGQDINDVDIFSLRSNLGVTFQETTIMPGTIRDNIMYGIKGKTDEDVIRAASEANVHDFISSLPEGYDTEISPQSRGLSGGQRQRLAIARVLLRDPKIFILDEPTSALDAVNEFMIHDTIHRCLGNRTFIVVAHRLSLVRYMDNIIVLSSGRIVEQGSFDELLKKQGHFFSLYNMQFGGFQKFIDAFDSELQRVSRYGQDLSMVMIEVENYNELLDADNPGLAAKFMEEFDLFIKRHIRIMDFSSVYIDDKIVIALPETDNKSAVKMVERLTRSVKNFKYDGTSCSVRAGIVSCKDIHAKYSEAMFEMASRLLADLPKKIVTHSDLRDA
jgi:ABC-type multidrug transport system fused ATPase/permease subunit